MSTPETPIADPTTGKPPRRRRWIPLSLRIFVAVLVFLGVTCAWFGVGICQRTLVVREIRRLGGSAHAHAPGPSWLLDRVGYERMRMFGDVDSVSLQGAQVTNDTLHQVAGLKTLERLDLVETQVTDAGMTHV